jgi:hypothetical protein
VDHSKAPELVRVATTPLLADAIVEGEIMDPGIVADAITACLAEAGVTTKDVVTAVGGRDVIIKKIQIERVKEAQARELMRWEAEQHVPFDMESVELDFQTLDPDGTDPEMSVLLVAAKRELVEAKVRVLADAGLNPIAVDVWASLVYARARVAHAAATAGVDMIDVPYLDLEDIDGMRAEATAAANLGFGGKGAIHPKQIPHLNEIFAPSEAAVAHARRVIEAFETGDSGLVVLDGKLLEKPVLRSMYRRVAVAEQIAQRAKR